MQVSLSVAHPWHGVSPGDEAPRLVTVFVEIVPQDTLKYEVDKTSGLLKIDRPQLYSSLCPMPYGFIPRTYCGRRTAELAAREGTRVDRGDGDPLDICILAEPIISRSGILMEARPVGGLRLVDGGEADDKIIAVMRGDSVFESLQDVSEMPSALLDRLRHYFLTYKQIPGSGPRKIEIAGVYGAPAAHEVIRASMEDYRETFTTS
ncbi:MAG: inorganic pyrophosphatase [Spirochaetales bacterium]|nr:inorganic pyrophosphatase [Spirochaetales bacterium]